MSEDLVIYTIGHSDHDTATFVGLLRQHGIALVADVRSQPYSRWAHQFNRETLARDLDDRRAWKGYLFEMLDALEEKGYVSQTRRAKKLALTEEGVSQAQEIKERYGL